MLIIFVVVEFQTDSISDLIWVRRRRRLLRWAAARETELQSLFKSWKQEEIEETGRLLEEANK